MKTTYGFTLIEMMVTIAILSVLAGIGGYSFLNGLPERRVIAASRDLYAGIREAQSEAINRGEEITITFNTDGDSYTIADENDNQINNHEFPDFINLYEVTGDENFYVFDARGMKNVPSSRVRLQYYKSGPLRMGVRVTSAGGISIIDETDANWE